MTPTHLSLNRSLIAHYADGSAVPFSQMTDAHRAEVLALIVKRFNNYLSMEQNFKDMADSYAHA